jgi:hypothetical protein
MFQTGAISNDPVSNSDGFEFRILKKNENRQVPSLGQKIGRVTVRRLSETRKLPQNLARFFSLLNVTNHHNNSTQDEEMSMFGKKTSTEERK